MTKRYCCLTLDFETTSNYRRRQSVPRKSLACDHKEHQGRGMKTWKSISGHAPFLW